MVTVIKEPADVHPPWRHVKWLALRFGQDMELEYESFADAVRAHVVSLSASDLSALALELSDFLRHLASNFKDEHERLERWFQLGAGWWCSELSLHDGLTRIIGATKGRLEEITRREE